jgi:hypothetical protein
MCLQRIPSHEKNSQKETLSAEAEWPKMYSNLDPQKDVTTDSCGSDISLPVAAVLRKSSRTANGVVGVLRCGSRLEMYMSIRATARRIVDLFADGYNRCYDNSLVFSSSFIEQID